MRVAGEAGARGVAEKPNSRRSAQGILFARFLADLLDQRFTIPGTDIRIGLDPLIGLIPGIGDAISNLAGSAILIIAARLGLPKVVLLRMGLNIAANAAIGSIPVVGDLFSIGFRSNAKNAELLERYATARQPASTSKEWILVTALLLGALLLLLGSLIAVAAFARWLWNML
jgi:hypothetical protein